MIRRGLKIVLAVFILLTVLISISGFLLYRSAIQTLNLDDYPAYSDLPVYEWTRVNLSDETMCSDGSDYVIYTKRGESNNLLVHFAGGGAAWNAETAAEPITLTHLQGYYFATIWDVIRLFLGGIFEQPRPENPFSSWNEVYIPYCTADFHVGDAAPTYTRPNGDTFVLHHNGRQNVTEALDWVFATFEQPEKLVISGESAGAFGSVLWTPYIAEQYTESDIYQIADGAFIETPLSSTMMNEVWNANSEQNFGFTVGDDIIGDAYLHYSENSETVASNVTYLHINTLYDNTLIYFAAKLNDLPDDGSYNEAWSQGMRASMARVADTDLDYNFYITDYNLDSATGTTFHTSISFPLFYEVTQDDVLLQDWVRRIVIEGERFSVGEAFLAR